MTPTTTGETEVNVLVDTFVPAMLLEELNERVDKVVRRAKKIGFPVPTLQLLEKVTGTRWSATSTPDEKNAPVEWTHIQLVGEPLRIGDWHLVASIDSTQMKDGDTVAFFRPVPNEVVPQSYRETDPQMCEHCNTRRWRTETFLVGNNEGEFKQLGRQCIRDFLGWSPDALIPFIRMFEEMIDELEGSDWGPRIERTWTFHQVLEAAAQVVAIEGAYVSRSKAEIEDKEATSATVRFLINPPFKETEYEKEQRRKYENADTRLVNELIEASMVEVEKLNASVDNEWKYNVYITANAKALKSNHIGVAASAIIFGLRTLDDRKKVIEEKAGPVSEYVGQIGEKVSTTVTVSDVRFVDSGFGSSSLVQMVDDNGNLFKTFYSGTKSDPEVGARLDIRGTIKKHEEFRGRKSTVITRYTWELSK